MLMLEKIDRTREFRASLVGLAARHKQFADAVQRFDHD
jgi:hypothetical protein